MSDIRQAAQQALNALEAGISISPESVLHDALRAALAAAVAEPVAYRVRVDGLWLHAASAEGLIEAIGVKLGRAVSRDCVEPLYAAPAAPHQREREPLTDEQIASLLANTFSDDTLQPDDVALIRAVERAHGIKEQP